METIKLTCYNSTLPMKKYVIISDSPSQTSQIAENFGRILKNGDFLALNGELGAGKTLFTKGIAKGIGIDENLVSSPTFAIVNVYEGKKKLFHIDLYRFSSASDVEESGIFDFEEAENGITVVEWPEIGKDIIPKERITINIDYLEETSRKITIEVKEDSRRFDDFFLKHNFTKL